MIGEFVVIVSGMAVTPRSAGLGIRFRPWAERGQAQNAKLLRS
jgi:hypothetical protein